MNEMPQHQQQPNQTPKKKRRKSVLSFGNLFKVLFILVLMLAIAWGVWSYKMYKDVKGQLAKLSSLEGQQELATQEIQKVLEQVGKHIVLPENEEPVVATVTNAEALAEEQPFYEGAKDDDKVIIYPKAGKAILFSPSDDIIVNVGPVYIDQANQQQPAEEQQIEEEPQPAAEVEEETPTEEEPVSTSDTEEQ